MPHLYKTCVGSHRHHVCLLGGHLLYVFPHMYFMVRSHHSRRPASKAKGQLQNRSLSSQVATTATYIQGCSFPQWQDIFCIVGASVFNATEQMHCISNEGQDLCKLYAQGCNTHTHTHTHKACVGSLRNHSEATCCMVFS